MSWHEACKIDEVPVASGHEVLVAGRVAAIFRLDGEFVAVDGMCAHQGGPIAQGELNGKCITCPWHGWQYDICDGTNLLTKKKMLDCFPCETRGDSVWIDFA